MSLLKSEDKVSCLALVAANLAPLIGVLFAGWDASLIVLLYWTENLIIGAYNILRMAVAKVEKPGRHLGKLFFIPFFCIHYGGFCGAHGIFLLFFFKLGDPQAILHQGGGVGPLVFLQILFAVVSQLWTSAPRAMLWSFASLVASHGISFVQNYLMRGEYARVSVKELMGRPYKRIVIMHVAIIAGGFFVMRLQSPLLKSGLDVHFHWRSHKPRPKSEGASVE